MPQPGLGDAPERGVVVGAVSDPDEAGARLDEWGETGGGGPHPRRDRAQVTADLRGQVAVLAWTPLDLRSDPLTLQLVESLEIRNVGLGHAAPARRMT
jgi:hypothetical protein